MLGAFFHFRNSYSGDRKSRHFTVIRTANDQVVCAFGSVAALTVGNAVFQTLLLVLLLCKLLLNFFFLGIQLDNGFLFWHIW